MSSFLTFLISLLFFAPIFSQKCLNPYCDGKEKPDPTCLLKYSRTMDYGNTYQCMEELLNQKYPGCFNSRTAKFVSAADNLKGSFKLTEEPFETQSYVCADTNCYTIFLRFVNSSFYCPEKLNMSCSLQKKITRDHGNSYICLEDFLNSEYNCPGTWNKCQGKFCLPNSVNYTMDSLDSEPQSYYCEGQGCPSIALNKTGSDFTCREGTCEYTDDPVPYENYPLKWILGSNKKWKCQDPRSSCGKIEIEFGKYVCAPKSSDCLNPYLVESEKCDRTKFDCREDYPGWFCERPLRPLTTEL